jgi:hypothetical protein
MFCLILPLLILLINAQFLKISSKKILKNKSNTRVAKWTDTLESKRKEKLRWKQEVLDREEAKRIEMDKTEEALRKQSMEAILARSKDLKYEENDNVRFLRSQQLYTEVIETREEQLREKEHREETRRREEREWHDTAMENLKKAEEIENQKLNKAKQKAIDVARVMEQQKNDAEMTKRNLLALQRKEEIETLQQIEKENMQSKEKEMQQKKESNERAKQEMKKVAMDAKLKQQLHIEVEKNEQEKRERDIARINLIAKTRAELEKKHFEEKQKARRILSERASSELEKRAAKEIEIFIRDQKAKELLEQKRKYEEERSKKELEDEIDKSRQSQISARAEKYHLQKQEEKALAAREHQRCLDEIQKEKDNHMKQKRINYDYRKYLEEQMADIERDRIRRVTDERAETDKVSCLIFVGLKRDDTLLKHI